MEFDYLRCLNCGQIETRGHWTSKKSALHCSFCENAKSTSWPDTEVIELISFVNSLSMKQPQFSQIASVFISAALEILLEQIVTMMLYMDLPYEDAFPLVNIIIESHQGRSRLLSLYKRFGGTSFSERAKDVGYPGFMKEWDELVETRNKFVHGKAKELPLLERAKIETLVRDGFEVFRQVHNVENEWTFEHKDAAEQKAEKEKALKKLAEWNSLFGKNSD